MRTEVSQILMTTTSRNLPSALRRILCDSQTGMLLHQFGKSKIGKIKGKVKKYFVTIFIVQSGFPT